MFSSRPLGMTLLGHDLAVDEAAGATSFARTSQHSVPFETSIRAASLKELRGDKKVDCTSIWFVTSWPVISDFEDSFIGFGDFFSIFAFFLMFSVVSQ